MKFAAACALTLILLPTTFAHAAAKPLPKDCSRAFVKAWSNRGTAATLPKPKDRCLLHAETGIYVCDGGGCARP